VIWDQKTDQWDLRQEIWDQMDQWDLHQKEWKVWMKCIPIWMMLPHTGQQTVQWDLHQKAICLWTVICLHLHLMIIQVMM
jgi:hypothetical protein